MVLKSNSTLVSVSSLFIVFVFLCILSFSLFLIFGRTEPPIFLSSPSLVSQKTFQSFTHHINVYVADLPRSLNYGLLEKYWSSDGDSRPGSDEDREIRSTISSKRFRFPPYPENPLIKQYSAEYWIMGDLVTPEGSRSSSFARRVSDIEEADVVFVPFFATLSAELQLSVAKGVFRKKAGNGDYERQKKVVDTVKRTEAWKRSGGRDHVFVLTDPVAMWHVRAEISPAVFIVVDFGGWYRIDSKASNGNSSYTVQHTQVSLIKDVIVPYTHLLPRLQLSENKKRHNLLYFKGAKHRHRGGQVREKLWGLLVREPGVVMEEGFPNVTGREQSMEGMRGSEFCLHPAGDTPTSCRLFDAIQSLCIPVIVSDDIELPFEGMIDYSEFSVFVAVADALRPEWLARHLRGFSEERRDEFRAKMAEVQPVFVYDSGRAGGHGPIPPNGAVNNIWRKVHEKVPMIKESVVRERRRCRGVTVPLRCHCT